MNEGKEMNERRQGKLHLEGRELYIRPGLCWVRIQLLARQATAVSRQPK